MLVVIFAGGKGTRLDNLQNNSAKSLIKITKNKNILEYLLNYYLLQGFNKFLISTGYNFKEIEYYIKKNSSVKKKNSYYLFKKKFFIKVINTGKKSNTGGRLTGKVLSLLKKDEEKDFLMTYCDGITNCKLNNIIKLHRQTNSKITFLSVPQPPRFGSLIFSEKNKNKIKKFSQKGFKNYKLYINGGFFVISKKVLDTIKDNSLEWESYYLNKFIKKGEVHSLKYNGFWKAMDTRKDVNYIKQNIKKEYEFC